MFSAGETRGVFTGKAGAILPGADRLVVRLIGKGGHGSAPHLSLDPVPAACELVLAIQSLVTRRFSPWDPVVVTVGRISAGSTANIIPEACEMEATVRTFSPESRDLVWRLLRQSAEGVAAAHGLRAEVEILPGYPVTVNDSDEWARVTSTVTHLFGADRLDEVAVPFSASEDFAFVLQEVPGVFVGLTAAVPGGPGENNHSPRAAFDDSVLPDGAALLAELALRRLSAG